MLKHPYYKLGDMPLIEVEQEISKWSRQDFINWLSWNDPNGVYSDNDSMDEFGNIMSIEEAREILLRQLEEGRPIR